MDKSQTAPLTSETSVTCGQMTCQLTGKCICSQASRGGALHFDAPDGTMIAQSGQSVARVHLSARQAAALGLLTSGTCGPQRSGSLSSANRMSSWESRLRQRLPTGGSTLFVMTWKASATPLGRSFFRLAARGRSISEKGFGSWPSQNVPNGGRSTSTERMDATGWTADGKKHTATLEHAVKFAAWPTATTHDADRGGQAKRENRHGSNLQDFALLSGWASPASRDWKSNEGSQEHHDKRSSETRGKPLSEQTHQLLTGWQTPKAVTGKYQYSSGDHNRPVLNLEGEADLVSGTTLSGSPAETESSGRPALNPRFSLWLMGFPAAWASCGERAMQSFRKSRPK